MVQAPKQDLEEALEEFRVLVLGDALVGALALAACPALVAEEAQEAQPRISEEALPDV